MSQSELVSAIVKALVTTGIDYMVTGSLASSMQGEPRASHDIDIVVDLQLAHAKKLIAALLREDFYISEEAVFDAIKRGGMFNVLPYKESEKIDFWLLKNDAYDQSRFSRKQATEVLGTRVNVSKPEDTILYKLKWAVISGGSEKQFRDALRVYEVQKRILDEKYMDRWAGVLGVDVMALLERIRKESTPVD